MYHVISGHIEQAGRFAAESAVVILDVSLRYKIHNKFNKLNVAIATE
jgi:hypothetical protein